MIIVSQLGDIIVNSKNVFSFFVKDSVNSGADLIASYSKDGNGFVLGSYKNIEEAKKELKSLFNVIVSEKRTGATSYQIQ